MIAWLVWRFRWWRWMLTAPTPSDFTGKWRGGTARRMWRAAVEGWRQREPKRGRR